MKPHKFVHPYVQGFTLGAQCAYAEGGVRCMLAAADEQHIKDPPNPNCAYCSSSSGIGSCKCQEPCSNRDCPMEPDNPPYHRDHYPMPRFE
jgi:hypothetical protein